MKKTNFNLGLTLPVATFPIIKTAFPIPPPDVVVTFTGLLLLRFHPRRGCEVGIVRDATHELRLSIDLLKRKGRTANPEQDEVVEQWEHNGEWPGSLQLRVVKPVEPGLFQYRQSKTAPLVRTLPVSDLPSKVRKDFRWAINFAHFHPKEQLEAHAPELFESAIRLNNGLFHTTKLFVKEDAETIALLLKREVGAEPFPPQAIYKQLGYKQDESQPDRVSAKTVTEVIGASIWLQPEGKVQFQWEVQNTAISLMKPQPGHYHRVVFNNTCRKGMEDECIHKNQIGEKTSDLPIYYGVLPTVEPLFRLDLFQDASVGEDYPCVPVIYGP
jgi:hypothetical protein